MIRNTTTNKAIRATETEGPTDRAPSRVTTSLADLSVATSLDSAVPIPASTLVAALEAEQERKEDDEPIIEFDDERDAGIAALSEVLSEVKGYYSEGRDKQCSPTGCSTINQEDLAEAWNRLGLIRLHMQGNAEEARKCHLKAIRIYKKNDQDEEVIMATTLRDLGFCYERLQRRADALEKYNESLEILEANDVPEGNLQQITTRRAIARLTPYGS